jgi:hypothetical protein
MQFGYYYPWNFFLCIRGGLRKCPKVNFHLPCWCSHPTMASEWLQWRERQQNYGIDRFAFEVYNLFRVCYLHGSNYQALRLMATVIFPGRRWCSCVQCPRQDLKGPMCLPLVSVGGQPLLHTAGLLWTVFHRELPLAEWMLNKTIFFP